MSMTKRLRLFLLRFVGPIDLVGINVNRYSIWAAGGMFGYNFGPVSVSVGALPEVN